MNSVRRGIFPSMNQHDRYEGLGYRNMIEWSGRLKREWPLFEQVFTNLPDRSLLDLGCGPGEHCARFASEGWFTTGVDVSKSQIETAREFHPGLEFMVADLGRLSDRLDRRYGAALCIGNVLPNLDDETCSAMLAQLAELMLPGAVLVIQQLEFGPILSRKRRSIGPIFQPAEGAAPESAFIRIFCPDEDLRTVSFLPTRLLLRPDNDPPVSLDRVESISWRARRRDEVEEELRRHGFAVERVWGSPERTEHDPDSGTDLWVVARRVEEAD